MRPTKKQQNQIRTAVNSANGIVAFSKENNINRGHVSLAYNGKYLSPAMCRVMGWSVLVEVPEGTIGNLEAEIKELGEAYRESEGLIRYLTFSLHEAERNQIPAGQVPVTPCPDCGRAHTVEWCVEREGEPQRPKPPSNRKRTYPSYAKMRTNDITQARRQFEKYYPEYEIVRKEK